MGIPVRYDGRHYRLEEGKAIELPGFWLRTDELAALLGLSHWLDILASGVLAEHLAPIHTRMEEILQARGINPSIWKERIRLLPMHHRPHNPDILMAASHAVLLRKRTCFLYSGVKDTGSRKRDVSPQTLVRYRDNWYLDGFDHVTGKLRAFALSRMHDFEVQQKPAREISRTDLDGHFADAYGIFSGRGKRKAILVFEGLAAKLAGEERWHPKQKTRILPGGGFQLEFPCGNVLELARDVMRYANEVTVVEPEDLRLEVEAMVRKASERFGLGRKSG